MNARVPLSLVFVVAAFVLFGQWTELDTLKPSTTFLSTEDSVLQFIQPSQSIVPSLGCVDGGLLNPLLVYQPMGSLLHPKALRDHPLQFSALPFLGFAYAFGTQGSQHMKFKYAQAFRHGLVMNVDYLAHSSNGFIRNNSWTNRDYSFKFAKVTGRYQAAINAHGMYDYRQFSGGLLIDSLANYFSLGLLPVRKDSCASTWKMKQLQVKQSMNFLNDSSRFIGLYEQASMRVSERNYAEYDSLYALYPAWFIDSNSTNDRFEWVSLRNEGGLGVKFNRVKAQVGGIVDYWRMRMLGNQRDTMEIGFNGSLVFQGWNWKAKLGAEQNISGGFKAFDYNGHLLVSLGHNHTFNVKVGYAAVAPDVFQRTYLGNTLQYHMLNPQLQHVSSATLGLDGSVFGFDYSLKFSGLNTKGVYQFNGLIWDNQSNLSSQQILVGAGSINKKWKGLKVGGMLQTLVQSNAVFPALTVGANLGYSGYITKSKSLYFFSTINYRYISGYKPLSILPQLSLLSLAPQGNPVYNLHSLTVLVGFKVKTFRFFIAGANLGTLWMPKDQPLYDHLPIPSLQLQVGISWEFWN